MSDLGYLKILLSGATLFAPLDVNNISSTHVQLHLSNTSLAQKHGNLSHISRVTRKTHGIAGTSPQWDDYIELRCCLGWDLKLSCIVNYKEGQQEEILEVDNLIVGTCTSGNYYIRQSTEQRHVCGEINLSIDFFPNHQSLRQLILDCCSEKSDSYSHASHGVNGLPVLLLTELQEMIKQQDHSPDVDDDDDHLDLSSALSASSSWIHLLTACQSLLPCAENSLSELSHRLYEQHFASSISSQNSPKSSARSGMSSHSLSGTPQAIEEYRVAATARSFLLSLTQDLPRFIAPSPTIYLIEKQLLIYRSCVYSTSLSSSSPSPSRSMSWNEVLRFVLLISVWFLQHSFIALSLSNEYNISPRELSAIRSRSDRLAAIIPHFERYDKDLSGDMPSADLKYLLQDMGENYSDSEISLLLSLVDADGLGIVEFPEIIRWWCDETPGDEEEE